MNPEPVARVDGLGVSYFPTARCKAVRFVEVAQLPADVAQLFARAPSVPELAIAFVDPAELSYRTFENIVPLDRVVGTPAITLSDHRTPRAGVHLFTTSGAASLLALDELGLYVPPMVAASRGGLRFIFHAAGSARPSPRRCATRCPPILEGFAHVNPVFRCNRFEPTDKKFRRHSTRRTTTRRTTSRATRCCSTSRAAAARPRCRRDGPRRHRGDDLRDLRPGLRPRGRAVRRRPKVFLRTELIFRAPLAHDPAIARASLAPAT